MTKPHVLNEKLFWTLGYQSQALTSKAWESLTFFFQLVGRGLRRPFPVVEMQRAVEEFGHCEREQEVSADL